MRKYFSSVILKTSLFACNYSEGNELGEKDVGLGEGDKDVGLVEEGDKDVGLGEGDTESSAKTKNSSV